jgi:hypothetical protein
VVIFETSGTIALSSVLHITTPYLTIAGQTAPSPGITLRNKGILIDGGAHDVLIQHLRVRPGHGDGVYNNHGIAVEMGAYNVVIDHCSVSWAFDESTAVFPWDGGTPRDVTFSNCIISEPLRSATNPDGSPSHGAVLGGNVTRISYIRNLLAHALARGPQASSGVHAWVNNVGYDFVSASLWAAPSGEGPYAASIISNLYIFGASFGLLGFPNPAFGITLHRTTPVGSRAYLSDNAVSGPSSNIELLLNEAPAGTLVSSPPELPSGLTILPVGQVETYVLANAGARPADRDSVDQRIINQTKTRTGRYITHENDVGGWPALAVNTRSLTLPSNPHTATSSGYTNLENWLHGFASQVEGGTTALSTTNPPPPPTNLRIVP